ncbi:MAG: dienelactone hydrolase family protein, partial [Planctomycetes bacterium]|nr:dienelactone hydrolase family protein [Planctomycetota bacterium]
DSDAPGPDRGSPLPDGRGSEGTPHTRSQTPATLPGNFPAFTTTQPASAAEWDQRRVDLRRTLWRLLGKLPPTFVPKATTIERQARDGCIIEKFSFDNGAGDTVFGYLVLPTGRSGRGPAILYHHYHTSQARVGKEELITPSLGAMPGLVPGEALARAGYVVMCIDAYGFGQRRFDGPGGEKENGNQTEESLFKMFLWQGRSLWGMTVRDDILALNCLSGRPEVDPARVGAMGFSKGATRTWWLAALDDRVRAAVSVGCLTRYQTLLARGGLRFHSIDYFVPGVLAEGIDAEAIVGLIAPRPHLTLTGESDEGSPVEGVRTINRFQEDLYRLYGHPEAFRGIIYPDTGHAFTTEMWQETLQWLQRHLATRYNHP